MKNVEILYQALKKQNIIEDEKLEKYRKNSLEKEQSLYHYLMLNNILSEQEMILNLAKEYNYTYLNLQAYDENCLPNIINEKWYKEFKALPIYIKPSRQGNILYIVTSNLEEIDTIINNTKTLYNINIIYPMLSEETNIIQLFDFIKSSSVIELKENKQEYIENLNEKNNLIQEVKEEELKIKEEQYPEEEENKTHKPKKEEEKNKLNNDSSILEMIQKIIMDAINSNVSDIHFEPFEDNYRIRFRQNNELYETALPPAFISQSITNKIKNIAKLNIEEKTIPQLGQINLKLMNGLDIDFRVSSFPTKFGEKIVLKIHNSLLVNKSFLDLGLNNKQEKLINEAIKDKGLIYIASKNREGKTTTAYNILKKIDPVKNNIYSLEKTSTLKIKNINQIYFPPNSKINRNQSLEYLEYQDVDAVFIDDVIEEEISNIIKLNKNKSKNIIISAFSKSIENLLDDLVKEEKDLDYILKNISLIIYQHKINQNCQNCLTKENWSKTTLSNIGFTEEELKSYGYSWNTFSSIGCERCNYKKINGNKVLFQLIQINELLKNEIYQFLRNKININAIKKYIINSIEGNLKEELLINIRKGYINIQEVNQIFESQEKNE